MMRCQLMFGPSAINPRRSDGIAVRRSAHGAAGFGSTRLSLRQCASRGQQSARVTSTSHRVVAARTHWLIAAGIAGDGRRVGGGAGLRGAGRGRTVTLPRRGDRVGLAVDSHGSGLRMGGSRKKQKSKADRHSHIHISRYCRTPFSRRPAIQVWALSFTIRLTPSVPRLAALRDGRPVITGLSPVTPALPALARRAR